MIIICCAITHLANSISNPKPSITSIIITTTGLKNNHKPFIYPNTQELNYI